MFAKASRFFPLLFALCLLLPLAAQAQGIGGAISGTVKDQTGAVIPGVAVRITNTATGEVRPVTTDGSGRYRTSALPPGVYDVTAELTGFQPAKHTGLQLSVGQEAVQDITLAVAPVGEVVEVRVSEAEIAVVESTMPTLSASFTGKQIRELPILTRDLNNLSLLAAGVFSVRTFSFASTLVPFAVNGSRGRDNNFIIDSVDNNEPLFGGAATQFTNTDLFSEYRILTNQFKAEYGRNSGGVVNIITERGSNALHGTLFWFGQTDKLNARNRVEKSSLVGEPVRFFENQLGATLGGPLKRDSTWFFLSYQWDRARNDLSRIYPLVATLPTTAGLAALGPFRGRPTVDALFTIPTMRALPPGTAPCGGSGTGLPTNNPCTIGTVLVGATPIDFGTYLVPQGGLFDVRDHQGSLRLDQRLGDRDTFSARYLVDNLKTPRTVGAMPAEVAFADFGLLPEWRAIYRQRTQNLGLFWTHTWAQTLNELRASVSRIAANTGAFGVDEATRESQPAVTVLDDFALSPGAGGTPDATASFLYVFPAAGSAFTLGRDTRATRVHSTLYQLQDNVSIFTRGHSLKFGFNFVRTVSNLRQMTSDLGQYFYLSFDDFVNNRPVLAWQTLGNFGGRGGDLLPLREFAQFYFFQADLRLRPTFMLNLGLRYEYFGQAINTVADLNPGILFNPPLRYVARDQNNFAPRLGFAWSPDSKTVLRGGYGVFYNPTVFNIALLAWQSAPVSPFVVRCFAPLCASPPARVFPITPFTLGDVTAADINYTTQDTVDPHLVNPYVQNFSLSFQRQFGGDFLFEVAYVASKGTKLFQRVDLNPGIGWETVVSPTCPAPPCWLGRRDASRGAITAVTNGARSTYHGLQVIASKRLRHGLALTAAYTWSHMIDNASEIFGPGVRVLQSRSLTDLLYGLGTAEAIEAITPFAQNPNNTLRGERGDSSFDRRHRLVLSYLWELPSPAEGAAKAVFGGWQLNGIVTAQTGQPFTPINGWGTCSDANGDGVLTNDRPLAGNPNVPPNSVFNAAVLLDCANPAAGYVRPGTTAPTFTLAQALGQFRFVQAAFNQMGNAGRNILTGPRMLNLDFAIFKNFPFGEGRNIQFRFEVYNLTNTPNPGYAIGNVYAADAQPVPAVAFAPSLSPARVTGVIPENAIDAVDPISRAGLFLSRTFMNTSSRRFQFGVKFIF